MPDRSTVLTRLTEAKALWPIIDASICELCAQPRPEQYARFSDCYQCNQLRKAYRDPLDELLPITYTAYDWRLGRALREFKADGCPVGSRWALAFGAILSAFLEHQLPRTGRGGRYDRVTTLPTSAPVIARALERANQEGWWVPSPMTQVATVAPGYARQRDRHPSQRGQVELDKWLIDAVALDDAVDVLVLDDMITSRGSLFSFAAALKGRGVSFVDAVVMLRNVGQRDAPWVRRRLEEAVDRGIEWSPAVQKRDVLRRRRRRPR